MQYEVSIFYKFTIGIQKNSKLLLIYQSNFPVSVGSSYMKEVCVTYFVSDHTMNEPLFNTVSKNKQTNKLS